MWLDALLCVCVFRFRAKHSRPLSTNRKDTHTHTLWAKSLFMFLWLCSVKESVWVNYYCSPVQNECVWVCVPGQQSGRSSLCHILPLEAISFHTHLQHRLTVAHVKLRRLFSEMNIWTFSCFRFSILQRLKFINKLLFIRSDLWKLITGYQSSVVQYLKCAVKHTAVRWSTENHLFHVKSANAN